MEYQENRNKHDRIPAKRHDGTWDKKNKNIFGQFVGDNDDKRDEK